jgi:phosphoribosylformimino-5-aminoimidazole carboxamide ribotide isomerase
MDALLAHYHFGTVYIADLDAITGRGHHDALLATLRTRYPFLHFWVDQGPRDPSGPWRRVIGSESLRSLQPLMPSIQRSRKEPLLSLDFRGRRLIAPRGLLRRTDLWPRDVIAMQLRRVGSDLGPDLALMHRLQRQARSREPKFRLYAAGGVRGIPDLCRLQRLGVAGVLLAGSLYDMTLDPVRLHNVVRHAEPCP